MLSTSRKPENGSRCDFRLAPVPEEPVLRTRAHPEIHRVENGNRTEWIRGEGEDPREKASEGRRCVEIVGQRVTVWEEVGGDGVPVGLDPLLW